MTRVLVSLAGLALVLTLTGCAHGRTPTMREAVVSPPSLQPGESAMITVKVNDRYNIVDSVVAVVREDPRVRLPLRDDGTYGDVEAGDGVWSLKVDATFQAPPGDFTLDIIAYRSNGEPIVVSRGEAGATPLSTTATVSIFYPDGALTAPVETPMRAPAAEVEAGPAPEETASP